MKDEIKYYYRDIWQYMVCKLNMYHLSLTKKHFLYYLMEEKFSLCFIYETCVSLEILPYSLNFTIYN